MSQSSRGALRQPEGTLSPSREDVVVQITNEFEVMDPAGNPYPTPRQEQRIVITIERDGQVIAMASVLVPDQSSLSQEDRPPLDDATLVKEINAIKVEDRKSGRVETGAR